MLQENLDESASINGINRYTIRTALSIASLFDAAPKPLSFTGPIDSLKEVWAAEIHGRYLYVAASDGDNSNHRIHIFKTNGDCRCHWQYLGKLAQPLKDNIWAIDFTKVKINGRFYAVWSGWENPECGFPQNIYIARMLSSVKIGPRHIIARPTEKWNCSQKPILEGPQSLIINGRFKGLLVTGNASWTTHYETRILNYSGGDPLLVSSWNIALSSFLPVGHGIGHGVVVADNNQQFYIGHRKCKKGCGWSDRKVFVLPLDKNKFKQHLHQISSILAN